MGIIYKLQCFTSFIFTNPKIPANSLERLNCYPNNLSLMKQKGSNIPSRCAIRRESHSVPRGCKNSEFQRLMPGSLARYTSQKMFDELLW